MGSLALLARQLGHQVSGSDQNVYPPMSTQLESQGIELRVGYDPAHLQPAPDLVVIGNTCSRGNPAVEYVLNGGLRHTSGPQWLAENILDDRWVLGVAGTHGKTTTTGMLTWILNQAGLRPGYLIGGVPHNFPVSADLGESPFFVIEADEYDSAFFDKRSKFIHYRPRTLIIGNLEFDHADIFPDLAAIQTQLHHLVKTVPANGLIIHPFGNENIEQVFSKGVWSERQSFSLREEDDADWCVKILDTFGAEFELSGQGKKCRVKWKMSGRHNVQNAIAAVMAAAHAGVPVEQSCEALRSFTGIKRRLELIGEGRGIRVYDDFAHHPTAIRSTLDGMRARLDSEGGKSRLIAVVEARSNTMKMGYHQRTLADAISPADQVYWYRNADTQLDLEAIGKSCDTDFNIFTSVDGFIQTLSQNARSGDHIVIMSNGGFEGLHKRLCDALDI